MRQFQGATIERTTANGGALVDFGDRKHWVPQSQIHDDSEIWREGESGTITLTDWIADKLEAEHGSFQETATAADVGGTPAIPVHLTGDQRGVFNRARDYVRLEAGDLEMPEGRVLELICADYLSGVS